MQNTEPLLRRLLAETLGSALLAATVVGSGIMAQRLAGGNNAVALLANTGATVAVLYVLIALLGPISGAHFNPAVSGLLFPVANPAHAVSGESSTASVDDNRPKAIHV